MDGLVTAIATAQFIDTQQPSITAAAGFITSLWTAGGRPAVGATPATGAGAVPTNATSGAISFTNPGGSNTAYLARLLATSTVQGTLILNDRLVHTSGLSGTLATAQTVATTAITRTYGGPGAMAYLEWYSATGSTAVTASISYTNQSGTSGQTGTCSVPASTPAFRMIPINLASGDTGVTAVASVTLSVTTGTAGNFGVTLIERIASIPMVANMGAAYDYAGLGLPDIQPSAALSFAVLASSTGSGLILAELTIAQG